MNRFLSKFSTLWSHGDGYFQKAIFLVTFTVAFKYYPSEEPSHSHPTADR